MIFLFWITIFLLAQTYVLYPISLALLGWIFGSKHSKSAGSNLKVSVLISAYNEEKSIETKIKNCLELEYPRDSLEILIGSDGSSDNTNSILQKYADKGDILFFDYKTRSGKAAVLNRLIEKATGQFVLFCDANTMLLKNSINKLLSNFTDPDIGCVCGRLILRDSSGSSLGKGESLYWTLESEIKKLEGRLGIVLGSNGGIYAIRKNLYKKIPENKMVMDDFFITTQVLLKGYKAVYEPLAIGSEKTSAETFGEFNRKIRIGQANFNMISEYSGLLNLRLGLVAYSFFSHKFLRWIGPIIFILAFLSNFLIIISSHAGIIYYFSFLCQCLFYFAAFIGYLANKKEKKTGMLITLPFYFLSMNTALLIGMIKAFKKEKNGAWDHIERTET